MIITKIPLHLRSLGMPFFWQLYTICLVIVSISIVFIKNAVGFHITNIIIHSLMFVGFYAALRSHRQRNFPRLLLVNGAGLIVIAMILRSLTYFDVSINIYIYTAIEEIGIVLIAIFAYIHMLMFEEKFNIKGFAIDFSLLIISFLFFFLLIFPNILNIFVYEINFLQQLLISNIFLGLILLLLSIVHYFLTRHSGLTDIVRILIIIFLIIHFYLEVNISFNKIKDMQLTSAMSWSIYHLAGTLTIVFIFIEKLSLDCSPISPSKLGNQFMWIASIVAIIAIPIGLVIRSFIGITPLNLLLVGIPSTLISSIVIWRFIILIKNSNQQKERLKLLIQTNTLTGLSNYHGYLEKITLANIKNILVIGVNIEDFKAINDLYGRDIGDKVLKSLAHRLKKLPQVILVAHLHSDLFLTIFKTKASNMKRLLKIIQEILGVWDTIENRRIAVPLTFGASYSEEIGNPEKLAKQAEQALNNARAQHTSLCFYSKKQNNQSLPRHELRHILQQALDNNYLPVHFQPIYNLNNGSLKALELLIRVDSKKYGLLLPQQFLKQANSYGLLTSLTQVCIKMVAKYYAILPDVIININLPPYMLKSPRLLNNFIHLFEQEELPPKKFCIEITEDSDISIQAFLPAIKKLKEYGFLIAMDDFGTGYSSLDRLSILSVDTIKIDRSLLLSASSGNTAILEWAISLAKRLGASVVVEGVETVEQLSLVKLLGADAVQGFLYSKPVSATQAMHITLNSKDIPIA